MRTAALLAVLFALAGCETTNSSDWTGGRGTPFNQAELTCQDQLTTIAKEDSRRDFFIGCMNALGWAPKPGASIAI